MCCELSLGSVSVLEASTFLNFHPTYDPTMFNPFGLSYNLNLSFGRLYSSERAFDYQVDDNAKKTWIAESRQISREKLRFLFC